MLVRSVFASLCSLLIFSSCTGNAANNPGIPLGAQTAPTASHATRTAAAPLSRSYTLPAGIPTTFTIFCPERASTGPDGAPYCVYYDPGSSSNQYIVRGDANCGVFDLESVQTRGARIGVFKVVGYSPALCTVGLTDSNGSVATRTLNFSGRTILGPLILTCVTNASPSVAPAAALNTASCRFADPLYSGAFSVETDSAACSVTRTVGQTFTLSYSSSQTCNLTVSALATQQQQLWPFVPRPLFVLDAPDIGPTTNAVKEYAAPYSGDPVVTIVKGVSAPFGITFDNSGNLFVANSTGTVTEYAPPYLGTPTSISVGAGNLALCVGVNGSGDLFVAVGTPTAIQIEELAPPYSGAPIAVFHPTGVPRALIFDQSGNLFLSNDNGVAEYSPPYTGTPIATIPLTFGFGIAMNASGDLFVDEDFDQVINEYAPPYTSPPILSISVLQPHGLAIDNFGNLFAAAAIQNGYVVDIAPPYTGAPVHLGLKGLNVVPFGVAFGPP